MRKASTRMLEQGTQRRPLLQTSSPLKTNNETQPETLIRIGTTNGGTSLTLTWQQSYARRRTQRESPVNPEVRQLFGATPEYGFCGLGKANGENPRTGTRSCWQPL
jgi:hypothetical protein